MPLPSKRTLMRAADEFVRSNNYDDSGSSDSDSWSSDSWSSSSSSSSSSWSSSSSSSWFSDSSGRKSSKRSSRKSSKWCVIKNKLRKVYKFSGLIGMRYSNRRKIPAKTRCYKRKSLAKKALKRNIRWCIVKKRVVKGYKTASGVKYNNRKVKKCYKTKSAAKKALRKMSFGKPNKSAFGNKTINPTNKYNYQMQQYATNVATPTVHQLDAIQQNPAYQYPSSQDNHAWFNSANNFSGYGF